MNPAQTLSENEIAIQLENVGVRYRLWEQGQPTLANFLQNRVRPRDFWALQEVSFRVRRGETVGLIGHNGAGKTTLLRVLARILPPQHGRVIVRGRISPLLELSAGMEADLTGRENILIKGAMLGRTRAETLAQMDRIIEFAELREFIDQPFRAYSSGMMARLGFAIATEIEPDILLIDEVMSVGDAEFSNRSRKRLEELRRDGATVLIASHNSTALRGICDRVIWLSHGRIQMFGAAAGVLNAYERASSELQEPDASTEDDAPNVYALDSDELLYALEFSHATHAEFQAAVQTPFDPQHISPARILSDIPNAPRQFLARYRFVRGQFFMDQLTRLVQRAPITLTVLRDPLTRARQTFAEPLTANEYTRWLGMRAPTDAKILADELYLTPPLTRDEFTRACDVLENLAFVGLYEKPRETLVLFWHTFGWEPLPISAPSLLAAMPEPGDDLVSRLEYAVRTVSEYPTVAGETELKRVHEWDCMLYAYARELFEARYAKMVRALQCRTDDPFEVHRALREKFARRAAQEGHARPLRWRMDRALSGRGWYNVEYNPQYGAYRWTGPEPRAWLQLPLPAELRAEDLQLRCNLIFQELSPALTRLELQVNDQPLTFTQRDAPDGSLNLESKIPRARLRDRAFVRIALTVGETYLSKNGKLRDSRKLGVAVRWIEVARYE